jgi:hypothetical protein
MEVTRVISDPNWATWGLFEGTQRSEVTISNVRLQSCRWLWHNAGKFLYSHTPQPQLLSGQESSQTSEILTSSFKI